MKHDAAGTIPAPAFACWWCQFERLCRYLLLTKPRIGALVTLTGLSGLAVEGSLLQSPLRVATVLLGIFLTAGGANGLNQVWDRDIDALMARTQSTRPIPSGRVTARGALCFSLACGLLGVLLLKTAGSTLAALLGIGAGAFYVLVYTMWLKRRTPLNIVIGGAAGAAGPLIGWAAGANTLGTVPLLMAMVIFLWSPPHFWSLAICKREEYARAGIPMLPVVAGEKITRSRIAFYAAILLPVTAFTGIRADLGWIFLLGSTLLGIHLMFNAVWLLRRKDRMSAQTLFSNSIVYLAAVFVLMWLP